MSEETTTAPQSIDPEFREQAIDSLKNVSDPELGVNIVDLGLIYDLAFDEEHDALVISMTLTSAGCPLTDVIENDIAEALDGLVTAFRINWVWMPPWTPERITDDGRDMMRALGFAI
ncbi:metal-sulfur cluster assembly factor [Leucobacter japonicus]|uniref:metal-sulfur cluster assembly factor n=1 Tax=Leucobacter japonicus TaxID=1461259 RepID=UPI0006A78BA4|nr:metal-sulfur cluster assembly factor [Leucobacter japonicus]